MRYLGSKTLLLEDIARIVEEYKANGTFCDPFGGLGTVGSFMKKKGYQVITGDILYFAHCFQIATIENDGEANFQKVKSKIGIKEDWELERYLNELSPKNGWLVEQYAENRKYFTKENAVQIQACLDCIQEWRKDNFLSEKEYKVLVASLIQSFDKVANTAGTYYAYLKDYYRKAKRDFLFELIIPFKSEKKSHAYQYDANRLVKECKCDILYLDPPYNERNYLRYYHLPENVAKGITPVPKGKSGVYVSEPICSQYNKKKEATEAFERLIENSDAGCIIFHYTDKGLIDMDKAKEILEQKGKIEEFYFDCKGYNTSSFLEKSQHHIIRVIR